MAPDTGTPPRRRWHLSLAAHLKRRARPTPLATAALSILLAVGLWALDPVPQLETWTRDLRQRVRLDAFGGQRTPQAARTASPKGQPPARRWHTLVVTFDDASINALEGWPLSHETFAGAIHTLTGLMAGCIAIDKIYAETNQRPIDTLLAAVREADQAGVPVIFPAVFNVDEATGEARVRWPLPALLEHGRAAFINLPADQGDVLRTYRYNWRADFSAADVSSLGGTSAPGAAAVQSGGRTPYSFALAAYLAWRQPNRPAQAVFAEIARDPLAGPFLSGEQLWRLDYYGPPAVSSPRITFLELYTAAQLMPPLGAPETVAASTIFDAREELAELTAKGADDDDADEIAELKDEIAELTAQLGARQTAARARLATLKRQAAEAKTALDRVRAAAAAPADVEPLARASRAAETALMRHRRDTVLLREPLAKQLAELSRLLRLAGNAVVLLGPWSLDSHDFFATPVSGGGVGAAEHMYGVEIHATATENLFELLSPQLARSARQGITESSRGKQAVLVVGLGAVAALLMLLLPHLLGLGVVALVGGGYVLSAFAAFANASGWLGALADTAEFLPIAAPVLGMAIVAVGVTAGQVFTIDRERRQIDGLFKNFMDERLVAQLKGNPKRLKLEGEERELSILFSDVAGFSGISEALSSDALVTLLNEYLGAMTDILVTEEGFLDKYMGDAVMAFWNAPVAIPEHAAKACRTALRQRARLAQLQEDWAARGLPRVDARIGINTGRVKVAYMGSERHTKSYTCMGDQVNLAARFEPLNKDFGTHVIVGQRTVALAGEAFVFRRLGLVQVKGKTQPVEFCELIGDRETTGAQTLDFIARFHAGLDAYLAGEFAAALREFERAQALRPDDGPCRLVYLPRCQALIAEPPDPATWTGVYTQTHK